MKIDAEKSRYHGDKGWDSDPDLFAKVAVTSNQWIGQSGEHLHAAQVLLPHIEQRDAIIAERMKSGIRGSLKIAPSLTGIYFLHCAFSVENAFKCVIAFHSAAEIEAEIRRTDRIPKGLLGHDLVELASKAGFGFQTNEEFALTFLSRYGTWAGRYPLPVHNDRNALTDMLSNGGHYLTGGYRLDQVPAFLAFAQTIYAWALTRVETLGTAK